MKLTLHVTQTCGKNTEFKFEIWLNSNLKINRTMFRKRIGYMIIQGYFTFSKKSWVMCFGKITRCDKYQNMITISSALEYKILLYWQLWYYIFLSLRQSRLMLQVLINSIKIVCLYTCKWKQCAHEMSLLLKREKQLQKEQRHK